MVRSYDRLGLPQLRDDARARAQGNRSRTGDYFNASAKPWWKFWSPRETLLPSQDDPFAPEAVVAVLVTRRPRQRRARSAARAQPRDALEEGDDLGEFARAPHRRQRGEDAASVGLVGSGAGRRS